MDVLEHDIKVLKKILNSELFLGKYPMINRVWVDKYGDNIDIVLNIKEPAADYWPIKNEVIDYIWALKTMAGVTSWYRVYP